MSANYSSFCSRVRLLLQQDDVGKKRRAGWCRRRPHGQLTVSSVMSALPLRFPSLPPSPSPLVVALFEPTRRALSSMRILSRGEGGPAKPTGIGLSTTPTKRPLGGGRHRLVQNYFMVPHVILLYLPHPSKRSGR